MRASPRTIRRLIHCSILAFGRGGRYFNRPAYDPVIQSLSGVAGTLARATGEPRFVPMVMSDHTSGLIAAQCIGFALYRREKTGHGEAIDVPMLENMASFVSSEHLGAATFDPPVGPTGDGRLLSPNYRPLPTKDGYITVRPNTNAQAFAFFDAIGRPELKTDPRFDSAASRTEERRRLFRGPQATGLGAKDDGRMGRAVRQARRAGGALQLDRRPVDRPASQGCRLLQGRGASDARAASAARKLANIFSGGARENETHAPLTGEHTREILAEAGYVAEPRSRHDRGRARPAAAQR